MAGAGGGHLAALKVCGGWVVPASKWQRACTGLPAAGPGPAAGDVAALTVKASCGLVLGGDMRVPFLGGRTGSR